MKSGLLGRVRALLASAANDFLEREQAPLTSSGDARLAEAGALLRDRLGLLFVEQRQLDRDIAAASSDLATLIGKAEFAVAADREDLARAALTHRDALEQRLAHMAGARRSVAAEIAALESAALLLSPSPGEAPDGARIAAQLAELDRLLQADAGAAKEG